MDALPPQPAICPKTLCAYNSTECLEDDDNTEADAEDQLEEESEFRFKRGEFGAVTLYSVDPTTASQLQSRGELRDYLALMEVE